MDELINKILEKDRVFGTLCHEAESSYKKENYFAALACLFVISEQVVKYAVDKIDGNFHQATLKAKEKGVINESEFKIIDQLRDFRNKLFHENHYSLGVKIKGINYPIDENEIKK